nr:MAG: DUF58 domain-containing protein [Leptolyngbya sp. IPPAS B-1204]
MKLLDRFTRWLETHWVNPAYSGWLLGGLALFFFAAATNTMAGWLYVISAVMVALLALAALLPVQTLRGIRCQRAAIQPVSVGEALVLELVVENQTAHVKPLIQVLDELPAPLTPIRTAIEQIPPQDSYRWVVELPTQQRGIYRWQTVQFRTAAPLGLFWCRRSQTVKAKAIVYPTVLPLTQCPLIDEMGQDTNQPISSYYQSRLATEGITRTLRPYRWGDSTRLIHWRSSARYGELRVRELETYTGGQELVIGLDSALAWDRDWFEQAVVAAASLYVYALRRQVNVGLWTAGTGLLRNEQVVLEALAVIQPNESRTFERPHLPLLWLTPSTAGLSSLPAGSRWLCWQEPSSLSPSVSFPGKLIQPQQPFQPQLQTPLTRTPRDNNSNLNT